MAEQDKRRTTTRRRGELKEVDDKKVSGQFWQLPSGQRSKRKAAAEAQVEESESSQPVTDNVAPSATAPPQGADAPAASNRPRTEPEDEISLKPSAILKRERHDSSSALHPLPPPGSVPSLASLAQKEINKEPSGGAFTAPAGGAPPPPPPPPLGKADRTEEEGGGTVRKPKRPRGKDFPEPAPSVQVGKPWMNERDVLGPLMYHVGEPLGDLDDSIGKTLQIYCPARYISHRNPEVIQRNLWGSHPAGYTDDSDVVCMLVHSALVHAGDVGPTDIAGVIAYIKVMPGLTTYPSSWDSSGMKIMKSRKWTAPHSASLRVERVELLERDHLLRTTYTLPQRPDGVVTPRRAPPAPDSEGQSSEPEIALKGKQDRDEEEDDENAQDAMQSLMGGKKKERSQKKDRILGDTVVMYNFSNEVCKKYTLAAVMDKGLDQQQWTAFRLKQQALYFENNEARFELSRLPPSAESPYDRYRWARVISPAASDMASFPLPVDYVQVLEDKLDWNDIQWGPTGCDVRGKSYAIKKVFWRAHRTVTPPPPPPAEAVAKASGRKQRSLDGKGAPKDAAPAASVEAKKEEASPDGEAGGSSTLVHLRRVPKKKKNA